MSDFSPDVEFLGFQVAAGESTSLSDLIQEDDVGLAVRPHITNVALGPNPKPGRHTVIAESQSLKAVIGTLEMGRCEQFQVDLVARDVTFSHTGKSDVHLTGYCTSSSPYIEGMSDDEDDDEDSEDDDEVPAGIPLKKSQLMPSKEAAAKQQSMLDDEASSSGDEDEDDDEDEDEDDEEEDSDEDDAARKERSIAYLKKALTSQPLNGNANSDDGVDVDDDDMEDDDEDEDEDEDGVLARLTASDGDSSQDESDSEDEPVLAQALKAVPGKRSAPPKVTPQPSKKAKITPAAAAAAARSQTAAPASQSGVSGPAAAQWQSALKAYLVQSGGETDMSKLGSVRKPEGIPKGQRLKAFLQQHADVFAVDGNSVTLK